MDKFVKVELKSIVDRIWPINAKSDLRIRELKGKELEYCPQGIKFYHLLKEVMIDKFGSELITNLLEKYEYMNISFEKDIFIDLLELKENEPLSDYI